jgi:intergrase/recombinase
MAYCRKIYASWLRQSGIESEIVDLLQGRIPKTVFARHYFTPSIDYRDRVIRALSKLRQQIELQGE